MIVSTAPIDKAKDNVPVTIQEIIMVSRVPTILQLIDLAMLRELLSLEGCLKTSEFIVIELATFIKNYKSIGIVGL